MSFQITYRLVQQTPLIHFQHDQKGATLRATEVKPKLDRFIIEKMGWAEKFEKKEEYAKIRKEYKNWFVGDTDALNYKMRLITDGLPEISHTIDLTLEKNNETDTEKKKDLDREIKKQINGMYFGNMVSAKGADFEEAVRESYKETVFYKERKQIHLIITCFIDELKKKIEEYMEEFFFVNNFGTRQSKGFGGFTAIKLNSEGIEEKGKDPIKTLIDCKYRFFYAEVDDNADSDRMLNHAKNVYAVMKGGYNHTGWDDQKKYYKYPKRYVKGYIQKTFLEEFNYEGKGSDKALIKSKKKLAIDKRTNKPYEYHKNRHGQLNKYIYGDNNYIFVRALLGLADYYEFKGVRVGRVDIFGVSEDGKSFDVERFKSPITIKVIGNKLVFIFGDFKPICNKRFFFAPNGIPDKNGFDKKTDAEKLRTIISTPSVFTEIRTIEKFEDDDIIDFINLFVLYFGNEKESLRAFSDNSINLSANLSLIIPKHLERSF